MRRRILRRPLSFDEQFERDHANCLPSFARDVNNDLARGGQAWNNIAGTMGKDFFKAQKQIHKRDSRI